MKRLIPLGLLAALLLLAGCSASIPIRPWMFIQNEQPTPMTDPAHPVAPAEAPQEEVLPS